MDYETLKTHIYQWNEDELFYKKYYYAKHQDYSLKKFLTELDMEDVLKRHLLIPEIKDTIPITYEESFFFDVKSNINIMTLRHNRFSPPLEHSHTFFEIIYVYDGKCRQTISNTSLDLIKGDICFVPPGIKHSIEVFDDSIILNTIIRKNTLHNIFFNFINNANALSAFFINNIYSENGNDYILFHTGEDFHIHRAFTYMYLESINQELYFDQLIGYTLMLSFGLLIRNYSKCIDTPTFTHKADVQRYAILQFIQDNYTTVTLEMIAKRFNYSTEYTSRLIKKVTGKNFGEILKKIRMEKAEVLLFDTNLSISSIAEQVGYENPEHFIRIFKKKYNMTPAAYRHLGHPL